MRVQVSYWVENDGAGSCEVHFCDSLAEAVRQEDAADDDSQMADRTASTQAIEVQP